MMTNSTLLWKFPGHERAHVWTVHHIDGDVVFLISEDHFSIAAVDTDLCTATVTTNDVDGARVRTVDVKPNLLGLVEKLAAAYRAGGAGRPGGGDR